MLWPSAEYVSFNVATPAELAGTLCSGLGLSKLPPSIWLFRYGEGNVIDSHIQFDFLRSLLGASAYCICKQHVLLRLVSDCYIILL